MVKQQSQFVPILSAFLSLPAPSPRERQPVSHRFVFLPVFAIFPKLSDVVWGVLFVRCSLSFTTARLAPHSTKTAAGLPSRSDGRS
jgi:hypothetical protein